MRRALQIAACSLLTSYLALIVACSGETFAPAPDPRIKTKVVDVGPLRIDRIYRSMDGPLARLPFDSSDIGWITRFRTEVRDLESGEPIGEEFFCHSQLQLDNHTRLLVAATGTSDVHFPEGFGMPLRQILSGVPARWRGLSVLGMVLNNHEPDMDREVELRITIDYISSAESSAAISKLYKVGVPVSAKGAVVLEGDPLRPAKFKPYKGLRVHWTVPPGPQVVRQRHHNLVPVPSTVHYAVVHLHNHGRYVRLTDVTEGKLLWQTDVIYEPDRVQIARIPVYSSAEGFPIYPEHEYEVETYYFNSGSEPVDAMAGMYLYYHPLGDEDITYPSPPLGPDHSQH